MRMSTVESDFSSVDFNPYARHSCLLIWYGSCRMFSVISLFVLSGGGSGMYLSSRSNTGVETAI